MFSFKVSHISGRGRGGGRFGPKPINHLTCHVYVHYVRDNDIYDIYRRAEESRKRVPTGTPSVVYSDELTGWCTKSKVRCYIGR